jgi:hypothetical protein
VITRNERVSDPSVLEWMYCNRTATGLVQARMEQIRVFFEMAQNRINKPNFRTHQDGLERTQSDCGSEGRGFESRRSPSLLLVKR